MTMRQAHRATANLAGEAVPEQQHGIGIFDKSQQPLHSSDSPHQAPTACGMWRPMLCFKPQTDQLTAMHNRAHCLICRSVQGSRTLWTHLNLISITLIV